MATTRSERDRRAELQAWYLGSLRPKLARAASVGTVAPAAADALDRQLRDFLDLPGRAGEEAA
ncbi:MAG TPA: hypothetical protein VLN26_11450 [Gaiellaceae bacterium]|nr:hypothetical protein [Gaiellaceae bacterium]